MNRGGDDDITRARLLKKLDPKAVRATLLEAGGFLALFELLRTDVILTPSGLFPDMPIGVPLGPNDVRFTKFVGGRLIPSKKYREVVLKGESDPRNAFRYAAEWLVANGAITKEELDELMEIRDYRNEVAHELQAFVISLDRELVPKRTQRALELLAKISRWRARNIDVPEECVDVADEDINPGTLLIGNLIVLGMIEPPDEAAT